MADSIGRVPPHNNEAEMALLGAILLRNKALEEVQGLLEKSDFYHRSHQLIWEGLLNLRNAAPGAAIDLVTLTSFLSEKGVLSECGGMAYIAALTSSVPVSTNATYYAQLIKNCSLKRQLLDLSADIGSKAFDDTQDVKKSIDELGQKLSELVRDAGTGNYFPSGSLLYKIVEDVQAKMAGKVSPGISSGFRSLDSYIGGFKPSDYIIIGARPSVGKTAFALSIAHNMAFKTEGAIKVGFFSLEMSGQTLMERLVSREASINSMALRNGLLDHQTEEELINAVDRMYDYSQNLLIQDTPNIKLMEIKAQTRRMVREEGVQIIFIDYIGLIETDGYTSQKSRHEEVGEISRQLKSLARELNIPVVCLAQVNREAGKDRQPVLADLRESGSIEQDADIVMLLDDPSRRLDENNKIADYENEDIPNPADRDLNSKSNKKIKVIIAKQRNGKTGAFDMLFRSNFVSFTDIERSAF